MAERIHTPEGTARWVSVFQPRQRQNKAGVDQGDPRYEITIIFDEDADLKQMKAAAQAAGVEKFGAKFVEGVKKGKYLWPFADNATKVDDDDVPYAGYENPGFSVKFKTKDKPGMVDADAEPIMDKKDVYDGMRARVSCRAFAYDNESKGVAFYLINVQKLGDGERMSGDPAAEDDFKPVKGAAKKVKKPAEDDDLL